VTLNCFTFSGVLWHRELNATVTGQTTAYTLAFNFGCTGPGTTGCSYNSGATVSGQASSPGFGPVTGATLSFKIARATEDSCGGAGNFDQSFVRYSTNSGGSYSALDLTGGSISGAGQYFAAGAGGEICGISASFQTVSVPLPAGTTNVAFAFDSVDTVLNDTAGMFIDDVRIVENAQLVIVVTDDDVGALVPGTCWLISYHQLSPFDANVPVDVVSDNNSKAACDTVLGGPLSDSDPAVGSIGVAISSDLRKLYGEEWRALQAQAPANHKVDTTKYACEFEPGLNLCVLSVVNDLHLPGLLNITVETPVGGPVSGTCWLISYHQISPFDANVPVDVVSDNNSKAVCDTVLGGPLSDANPAVGAIDVAISVSDRTTYGEEWRILQVQSPPGYTIDSTKYACVLTDAPDPDKCDFLVNNQLVGDTDGDGCPDVKEQVTTTGSQFQGGLRDYLNLWDYFNPEKVNTPVTQTVSDIIRVIQQYNKNDTDGNPGLPPYAPGYTPTTDRTGIAPYPWSLGPPNGQQTVVDILAAVRQFGHNCP
jgi:hypothetical protein